MLRKILAVLLVFTMLIGIVPTTAFAQTEETIVADTTIIETSEKVVAKQEVEDCTVQFEYLKDSKWFSLFRRWLLSSFSSSRCKMEE